MVLNTFKSNHLMPLHFKGLNDYATAQLLPLFRRQLKGHLFCEPWRWRSVTSRHVAP